SQREAAAGDEVHPDGERLGRQIEVRARHLPRRRDPQGSLKQLVSHTRSRTCSGPAYPLEIEKRHEKASAIPDLVAVRTKEASEKAVKSTNDSVSALSRKVFSLEYRHLKTKMESNPSNNMALTDALRLLQLCLKKAPNEIPDIMHFMLKKIDLGGKLTATEITELNEALDLLPSHYSTLTEKLRAKLIASDIF